jgi:hemolysin activation/secretion protein
MMYRVFFSGRASVLLFSSLFFIFSIPFNSYAQSTNESQRQHEQRLKEEQDRMQERLRRDLPKQDVFLQPTPIESNDIPADENAPCINVSLITVQGVTLLDDEQVESVTKSFMARCLSLTDINKLIAGISNLYLDKGFITSRAFVQPQKIEKGTLDLLVVEGKIEKIQSPDNKMKSRQLRAAFPIGENELLNLRDLEQGIEQLNRLQQNAAQLDIKPGADTGKSIVNVVNDQSRSLHAQIFVDNSGSEATGQYLVGTSLSWDNPLDLSDSLYINLSEATHGAPGGSSQSYAVNYSIPQGYFLWSISANHFNYEQLVSGASIDFTTSGESDNQSISLDYVAFRGQRSKFSINSDLTKKISKNYIEDVFLDTSSRTLYLGGIGINSTYKFNSAMLRGGINWTSSFDAGDATQKLSTAEVDYQFNKYDLDLSIYGGFSAFKQNFQYNSSIHYFYSPTSIVASEALSIGGQYSVRGFDQESITGYKGGYWRSEISYPQTLFKKIRLEPFLAYDLGKSDAPDYQKNKVTMSGATFGFRSAFANFSANAAYSTAVAVPEFLTKKQSVFIFDARLSF